MDITIASAFKGLNNLDWQPMVEVLPGVCLPDAPFCLVPVGRFIMGYDQGSEPERPARKQVMKAPYWIVRDPVSNAQWARGVAAGVVAPPIDTDGLEWYNTASMADYPVAGVTWDAARDFARWAGCRLPNEREWEFAARGVESWLYPRGNTWDGRALAWDMTTHDMPEAIGKHPTGTSWVGACDLCGNVDEWVRDIYRPYPYRLPAEGETDERAVRVLRGGSWHVVKESFLRASCRTRRWSDSTSDTVGLRLAFG